MSPDSVLVCVPTYNAESTLERTLISLQKQTYNNFRVLVVDNCSTDGTLELVQRFVDSDSRFSVIVADAHGSAEDNFNRCISMAEGCYTALFHSDDEYLPEMLEAQVEVFRAHSDVGVVFTRGMDIDANGNLLRQRACPNEVYSKFDGKLNFQTALSLVLAYGNFFICPTAMFRSSLLKEKVQRWDGTKYRSSADLDVWLRSMQHANAFIIDQPLIRYRVSSASFTYHYGFLRTEAADIIGVFRDYIERFDKQVSEKDKLHYRLQCFKDSVNQSISHLLLDESKMSRQKLLSSFGTDLILASLASSYHRKFLLYGVATLVLSCFPLGSRFKQLISKIRFGR